MKERTEEFRRLVKATHDIIDDYADARLNGNRDWFAEGLEDKVQTAVHRLLAFGVTTRPATEAERKVVEPAVRTFTTKGPIE